MSGKVKTFLITGVVLVAFILMIVGIFVSTNNKAISLEEQLGEAQASIKVQEKRRVDLIYNLVDVVEEYAEHEKSTLAAITEARSKAGNGKVEDAQVALNAVAEAYPELKANDNYKQLMTELALTENSIAAHRNNLNNQIKSYNKFCRKFPNSSILNVMGYEKLDLNYTYFDAPVDAPQDLFGEK